jgi:hypothetical protein
LRFLQFIWQILFILLKLSNLSCISNKNMWNSQINLQKLEVLFKSKILLFKKFTDASVLVSYPTLIMIATPKFILIQKFQTDQILWKPEINNFRCLEQPIFLIICLLLHLIKTKTSSKYQNLLDLDNQKK